MAVSKKERFAKGFFSSVIIHIFILFVLAILGLFTYSGDKNQPFDVLFIGGGGGGGSNVQSGGAAEMQEQAEDTQHEIKPDDITEQRKPLETKPAQKPAEKPQQQSSGANANTQQSAGSGGGQGSGAGSGKGPGEGSGTGGGSGSGVGTGTGGGIGPGAGQPVTLPRLLNYRDPEYPFVAMRDQIEGTVYVQVMVTAGGVAQNPVVVRSSGRRDFDSSALQSARGWRFSPAKDTRGVNVSCNVTIPVNFKMKNR